MNTRIQPLSEQPVPVVHSQMQAHDILRQALDKQRLVVFLGAGASSIPPTCLPTWSQLQKAVLQSLGSPIETLYGEVDTARLISRLLECQGKRLIPPEYVSEIMSVRLPGSYFDVLRCLDSDTPNEIQLSLATLAKAGRLRAIVTTNFDQTVEAAFAARGTPLDVLFKREHFDKLAGDLSRLADPGAPCLLLKLHGTADQPGTLIDTLFQRKVGFPASTSDCVRHLLKTSHWLFMGYSGADLEADPNYLFLRGDAETAAGFTWLVRDGSTPPSAVTATAAHYGKKAAFTYGVLPDFLRPLLSGLPRPEVAEVDVQRRQKEAAERITQTALAWTNQRGGLWCSMVVSDLLEAYGDGAIAHKFLEDLTMRIPERDRGGREYAAVCDTLGLSFGRRGDFDQAITWHRQALATGKGSPDWTGVGASLGNIGNTHERRGDWLEAIACYREELEIYEQHAFKSGWARATMSLANAYYRLGDVESALSYFQKALGAFQDLGDEAGRATVLNNLSNVFLHVGQPSEARAAQDESLKIRSRLGDLAGQASTLDGIAQTLNSTGKHEEALCQLSQALAIRQKLEDQYGMAQTLSNMAVVLQIKQRDREALDCLNDALVICERIKARPLKGSILLTAAAVECHLGNPRRALKLLQEALILHQDLGNKQGVARTIQNMGSTYVSLGDKDKALNCYRDALKSWELLDYPAGLAETHFNLGVLFLEEFRSAARAEPHFRTAIELYGRIGSPMAEMARRALRACVR
jgi:tetratricopeptide (TPR) repeat protein